MEREREEIEHRPLSEITNGQIRLRRRESDTKKSFLRPSRPIIPFFFLPNGEDLAECALSLPLLSLPQGCRLQLLGRAGQETHPAQRHRSERAREWARLHIVSLVFNEPLAIP